MYKIKIENHLYGQSVQTFFSSPAFAYSLFRCQLLTVPADFMQKCSMNVNVSRLSARLILCPQVFFFFSGLVQHKGGRRGQKGEEGWSYEVLPLVFTQHILRVGFVVEGEFRTVLRLASLWLLCLKRLFPSVQTPTHDGQRWQDDKYHHGDDTCRQTEDIIIQLYCCILGLTSL